MRFFPTYHLMKIFQTDNRGVILIEMMITLCLFALLLSFLLQVFQTTYMQWSSHIEHRDTFEEMQYALHYIEKMTKRMDQQSFSFHEETKTLFCRNYLGEHSYFDFSGDRRADRNTYLYFDRSREELMTNRNKEYNTLIRGVKNVEAEYEQSGLLMIRIEMGGMNGQYSEALTIIRIVGKGEIHEQ